MAVILLNSFYIDTFKPPAFQISIIMMRDDDDQGDNDITFDNEALGNMPTELNTFEDERYKLQRDMLIDEHGEFLIERLRQIPEITPRARTKLYSIITTYYSKKNIVSNYADKKEIFVAFANLEIALELFYLSLDAYDTATNDLVVLIELIRSGYYPTVFRSRGGFERTQQNTQHISSEQRVGRFESRKPERFRVRRK